MIICIFSMKPISSVTLLLTLSILVYGSIKCSIETILYDLYNMISYYNLSYDVLY